MAVSEDVEIRGRGITAGRYYDTPRGIFDTWGGYYIDRAYWDQRLAEGRSDTARHLFRYVEGGSRHAGQGYYLNRVRCDRCGEEREIGISVSELNETESWCVSRRSSRSPWWRFWRH